MWAGNLTKTRSLIKSKKIAILKYSVKEIIQIKIRRFAEINVRNEEKLWREEIIKKCDLGGIAFGRISNIEQFSKHPQNQFIEIDAPNGKVKMVAPGAEHNGKHLLFLTLIIMVKMTLCYATTCKKLFRPISNIWHEPKPNV